MDETPPDDVLQQCISSFATTIALKCEAAKAAVADMATNCSSVLTASSIHCHNAGTSQSTSAQAPEQCSGHQRTQRDRARVC